MFASSSLSRYGTGRSFVQIHIPTSTGLRRVGRVLAPTHAAAVDSAQQDAPAAPTADWQERPAAVPEQLEASTSYDEDQEEREEVGWPVLHLAVGQAENTRVKTAKFVKSSVKTSEW